MGLSSLIPSTIPDSICLTLEQTEMLVCHRDSIKASPFVARPLGWAHATLSNSRARITLP